VGFAAAGRWTPASGLIVPATVLLFLGRFAAIAGGTRVTRLQRSRLVWTGVYFAASAACLLGAVALAPADRRGATLVLAGVTGIFGVANAALVLGGRGRWLFTEVLAMTATAAAAPLVLVLAGRPLGGRALGVGALCLAYFLSTLAFVRAHRRLREARSGAIATCATAHAALVAALLLLVRLDALPGAALLAFVPPVVRTFTGLARPARNLRVLGWREVAVAGAFLVLAGFLL
jgi:hypothetical protein